MPQAGADPQASFPVNRLGWWSAAFVGLLGVWVLLHGLQDLAVGVLTAAVASLFPARLARTHLHRVRAGQLLAFLGYFVVQSFRGAVDVAGRALRPAMPLEPEFFRYPLSLPAGLPRGLMMGTLSLLPGSLSVDLEDDEHTLLLHSIVGDPADEIRALESRISRLFGIPAP